MMLSKLYSIFVEGSIGLSDRTKLLCHCFLFFFYGVVGILVKMKKGAADVLLPLVIVSLMVTVVCYVIMQEAEEKVLHEIRLVLTYVQSSLSKGYGL